MSIRTISLAMVPFLLVWSTTSPAQDGMGGMGGGGMGGGGMGGGGMGGGGMGGMGGDMDGGGMGRHGGGRHGGDGSPGEMGAGRPSMPKPIKRDRFDKLVTGMFHTADVNHDGMVTIEELRGLFETRRYEAIRARFAKIDTNHNGTISPDEFLAWQTQMGSAAASEMAALGDHNGPVVEAIMPDTGGDREEAALARLIEPLSATVIAQANTNYDGGVSLEELLAYEGKRFDAADTNHDGWLTMDELRPSMRHGPGSQGARTPPCPPGTPC